MKKVLIVLALLITLVPLAFTSGCTTAATSTTTTVGTGTATPPTGTTSITLGSAGNAKATTGSTTGTVYAFILNQLSNPLNNLLTGNLKIFISGPGINTSVECTVSTVTFSSSSSGNPTSVALTLDRSGSMAYATNLSLEAAATAFVNGMGSSDQGAVVNFDSSIDTDQSLTSNKTSLIHAITNPTVGGGATALFDSIATAVTTLDSATSGNRKAVIAMTDGGENSSSSYTTVTSLVNYAKSKSVPVYTVGLGLTTGSSDELNLQNIATGTGGVYYYAPNSTDLLALYNKISSALSNFYTITFTLPSSKTFTTGTYVITFQVVSYGSLTGSATISLTI